MSEFLQTDVTVINKVGEGYDIIHGIQTNEYGYGQKGLV